MATEEEVVMPTTPAEELHPSINNLPTLDSIWMGLERKTQKNLLEKAKKWGYTLSACRDYVALIRPPKQRAPRKVQPDYVAAVAEKIKVNQSPPIDLSGQFDSFEARLMERISKMVKVETQVPTEKVVPESSKVEAIPEQGPAPTIGACAPGKSTVRRRFHVC